MKNIVLAVGLSLATSLAAASNLNALVLDKNGKPVVDAVVLADNSTSEDQQSQNPVKLTRQVDIVQIDKDFVPYVTVISVGTLVNFPNKDNVKHHVYSFSPSKKFDLPLYSGTSAPPVRFDKSGIVVIGCNIHDWMIGYIYVANTPYFGKTDKNGKVTLKDLPAGKYTVHVWHPDTASSEAQAIQTAEINGNESADIIWHIDIKPKVNPRHSALPDLNSY